MGDCRQASLHEIRGQYTQLAGFHLHGAPPQARILRRPRDACDLIMRRVYSAENSLMAGHMMGLLEQAGIDCVLRNDMLWGAMGQLPPTECWPEVWVCDDGDYSRALGIIEEAMKPAPRSWPWTCGCGERLEGQFTACWRCGRDRED